MWKQILILSTTLILSQDLLAQEQLKEEIILPFTGKIAEADAKDGIVIPPEKDLNNVSVKCTKETSETDEVKYEISNLNGEVLLAGKMTGCADAIHITALPYGEYMLQLSNKNSILAKQKIIKE